MHGSDFLVLGAGMAGASAAYELAGHGSVTLLERESQPGYHATGRSAALYTETYGPAPIRALTAASRAVFEDRIGGLADRPVLSPRAVVITGGRHQIDKLDAEFDAARRLTPSVRRLHEDAARAAAPMLRPDAVAGAVWEPDAADLDVHAIHMGYLKGLKARGGRLVCDAEAAAIAREDGRWQVDSRAGRFSAPILVNAAGAWADQVAVLAGLAPLGLVPKRRTVILFDPVFAPGAEPVGRDRWPMVIDADESFYFKPESGRLLASPGDATPVEPCDVQPEDLDVAVAVDRIEQVARFRIPRIQRRWAGLRSFFADGIPVCGFDPRADGLFWLAGQGGYGIQTAPALARATANLIVHRRVRSDLLVEGLTPDTLAPDRLLNGANAFP